MKGAATILLSRTAAIAEDAAACHVATGAKRLSIRQRWQEGRTQPLWRPQQPSNLAEPDDYVCALAHGRKQVGACVVGDVVCHLHSTGEELMGMCKRHELGINQSGGKQHTLNTPRALVPRACTTRSGITSLSNVASFSSTSKSSSNTGPVRTTPALSTAVQTCSTRPAAESHMGCLVPWRP